MNAFVDIKAQGTSKTAASDDPPRMWLRKLQKRTKLDDGVCTAILSIPYMIRSHDRETFLIQEGKAPDTCSFILSGMTYRSKVTSGGERQIVGIDVPGDLLSANYLFLNEIDHNVQALTPIVVADFSMTRMRQIAFDHPEVGRAMWTESLVAASIAREWMMSVGRRDASQAITHLLCELVLRLTKGSGNELRFDLPMSQSQIGDIVGLSLVHVNRTLMELAEAGLIERQRRSIVIRDLAALSEAAGFSARYLHLSQHGHDRRADRR